MKKLLKNQTVLFLIVSFFVVSCSNDNTDSQGVPTLNTTAASIITATTASSGGLITNAEGVISTKGVVWSTLQSPTIDLLTKTNDGSGTGGFTSSLTSLSPATTYYIRAYATNENGTGYGNQVTFITTLPSVTIGTQIWTSENLDVVTYRDGTPIPQVTDPTAWAILTTGAWCYYNNDSANGAVYGKLYNWYAVAGIYDAASLSNQSLRKQLAPAGYHIPSDTEWSTLTTYLEGESLAGGKMKETGTTHWKTPNTNATNSSVFTGLPGGYRYYDGSFGSIGSDGIWWSSTELNTTNAWLRDISYDDSGADRSNGDKKNAVSVRCLKD
jgi:uncharacterized protein (TIGR02145 family)